MAPGPISTPRGVLAVRLRSNDQPVGSDAGTPRIQLVQLADRTPVRVAPLMVAPCRLASARLALVRFALVSTAFSKLRPLRS